MNFIYSSDHRSKKPTLDIISLIKTQINFFGNPFYIVITISLMFIQLY